MGKVKQYFMAQTMDDMQPKGAVKIPVQYNPFENTHFIDVKVCKR